MLEGHVEETALLSLKLLVEALVDRSLGNPQGQMISRELLRMAAKHVARELVEQDHAGERRQGIRKEGFYRKLALLRPQLEEALPDAVVDVRAALPPFV